MGVVVALGVLRRRWYLVVIALGLCAAASLWTLQRPGVYHAEVEVVLLNPGGDEAGNALSERPGALIDLAGITAKSVSGTVKDNETVSEDVSLMGRGEYAGWSVSQPNVGGQWNYSFDRPVVAVQVTGSSPDQVRNRLGDVVTRVRTDIDQREAAARVLPANRVRTLLNPEQPGVFLAEGDRRRAAAGLVVLSVLATVGSVLVGDRMLVRWPTTAVAARAALIQRRRPGGAAAGL